MAENYNFKRGTELCVREEETRVVFCKWVMSVIGDNLSKLSRKQWHDYQLDLNSDTLDIEKIDFM